MKIRLSIQQLLRVFALLLIAVTGMSAQLQAVSVESVLQFKITGPKSICVGRRLPIAVTLFNRSAEPIRVDSREIWRIIEETGPTKPAKLFGSEIADRKLRISSNDLIVIPSHFESRMMLLPGKSYHQKVWINTKSDAFYDEPGLYTIKSTYSGEFRSNSSQVEPTTLIESNTYSVKLNKCHL